MQLTKVAGVGGFEPPTGGFGDRCSPKLSYTPTLIPILTHFNTKINRPAEEEPRPILFYGAFLEWFDSYIRPSLRQRRHRLSQVKFTTQYPFLQD